MKKPSDEPDELLAIEQLASPSPSQQRMDVLYMQQALQLAHQAGKLGEVPVGSVVIRDGELLGTGMNRCVMNHDPSAHAEVLALREAGARAGSFRLDGATLYVTLEPCLMCCGALLQARIARLVFGAREPGTGGVVSIHEALRLPRVNHHVAISEGVRANDSKALLREFFQSLR